MAMRANDSAHAHKHGACTKRRRELPSAIRELDALRALPTSTELASYPSVDEDTVDVNAWAEVFVAACTEGALRSSAVEEKADRGMRLRF